MNIQTHSWNTARETVDFAKIVWLTLFAADPFPVEIRNHAWTRFGDSFLIAGGRGGVQSDGVSDLDTIYRCVRQSFSCWNQTWYHQFTGTSLVTTHGRSWTQDWKIPRVHYPSWWLETCVNNKNKWQFIKKTNKIQLENEDISVIRAPEIHSVPLIWASDIRLFLLFGQNIAAQKSLPYFKIFLI